jgi:hypothetical protein
MKKFCLLGCHARYFGGYSEINPGRWKQHVPSKRGLNIYQNIWHHITEDNHPPVSLNQFSCITPSGGFRFRNMSDDIIPLCKSILGLSGHNVEATFSPGNVNATSDT